MRAVAIVLMLGATAFADPGDPELAAGEQLATQGRFKDAIVQFKAARAAAPTRSEPDCLIALAYRRLERWGQARLFLTRCMAYPTHPQWFPQLVTDIDDGLSHAGFTQVAFTVKPDGVQATLAISSFAPDETFMPQTVFVEPGKALVTATAPGYEPTQLAIDVPATSPFEVPITLKPQGTLPKQPAAPQTSPGAPPPAPLMMERASPTGNYVVYASASVIAIGIAVHIAAAVQRADLTTSAQAYDAGIGTFHTERDIAIGAYAVGAIGFAVGAYLWHGAVTPVVQPHATGVAWSTSW